MVKNFKIGLELSKIYVSRDNMFRYVKMPSSDHLLRQQ